MNGAGDKDPVNMLPAVNNRRHFRFMTVNDKFTSDVFCDFLQRLITGIDRKIFLIIDGRSTSRSHKI